MADEYDDQTTGIFGGRGAATDNTPSGTIRGAPDVDPAVQKHVAQKCKQIQTAKTYFDKDFKQMRKDMEYARLGAEESWVAGGNYFANITNRHINQTVGALYAKNPKAEVKRRKRMDFRVWDGDPATLQSAMMAMQAAMADPLDKQARAAAVSAQALLADVQAVQQKHKLLDKIGKTLEICFEYFLTEQQPKFKTQLKQMVRRTKVCGIGWLELGFQRQYEQREDVTAQIYDLTSQMREIQRLQADIMDGETDVDSPKVVELKGAIESLRAQGRIVAREGPLFSFPRATQVIVDPKVKDMQTLHGADWLAIESDMTPEQIQKAYKVDVGKAYTSHRVDDPRYAAEHGTGDDARRDVCKVWRVQDRVTGTTYAVAEGYPGYLSPPKPLDVKLERFFTLFPLIFNNVEDEKQRYPYSDVYYMRPMQDEINRARQGLREHKHANRPAYATVQGRLADGDKDKLANRPANAVLELMSLLEGESVDKLIQPIKPVGIDPNVYETRTNVEDILRVVGAQEANFGPVTGDNTATETSIAEGSRMASLSDNVDDLDELLSDVAQCTGQLMLLELSPETVKRIAGDGAVWPELTRDEVVRDIWLSVRAGSSGKPNRAAELANMERGMPFIIQIPGFNPTRMAMRYAELLEMDPEDVVLEGMPSITALNGMLTRGAGEPGTNDPSMQGGQGGDNAPREPETAPGPQPGYPTAPNGLDFAA